MNNSKQSVEDYYTGTLTNQAKSSPAKGSEISPPNNPVSVIQELCECNQALLTRIANLEQSLTSCQQKLQSSILAEPESTIASQETQETRESLAIAHQVAVQQEQLIALLAQQLESNLQRVADFERDFALSQLRYREHATRLVNLDQENKTLQSRLQRQQYYSLQLKAALEKTLRQNQVDPSWLERVWSQLVKEGGLASPSAAISSWSQNCPDASFPTPKDFECWLDNLKSEDSSPWSASEVLFVDDASESAELASGLTSTQHEPQPVEQYCLSLLSNSAEGSLAIAKGTATISPSSGDAALQTYEPVIDLEDGTQSCSFQLADMVVKQPDSKANRQPKPLKQSKQQPEQFKKPSAPDLPSFLKPRH